MPRIGIVSSFVAAAVCEIDAFFVCGLICVIEAIWIVLR